MVSTIRASGKSEEDSSSPSQTEGYRSPWWLHHGTLAVFVLSALPLGAGTGKHCSGFHDATLVLRCGPLCGVCTICPSYGWRVLANTAWCHASTPTFVRCALLWKPCGVNTSKRAHLTKRGGLGVRVGFNNNQ